MKIVMTTVGTKGPGEKRQNEERLGAAERALRTSNKLGADLIVLPAGYFTASNASTRNAIAQSLVGMAKEVGIAIIFGVDQEIKSLSRDYGPEIQKGGLPFYGYAWSPSENILYCWSQRSTNSRNQWWAPEGVCREVRLLSVRNERVAMLMCGEIFNYRIRDALVDYRPRPEIVVDVAHIGAGFRVAQGMNVLARLLKVLGIEEVKVTGRTADGGIDVEGTIPILNIRVAVQAKRYALQNSVGIDPVQRLIGSVITGGYARGIFITTSNFAAGARETAITASPGVAVSADG